MIALQFVAACVFVVLALPAIGATPPPAAKAVRAAPAAAPASVTPAVVRRTPFTHFGSGPVLQLLGHADTASVDFGNRADELVTRATLHLRYAYSPALAPGISHIRLVLNDDLIGTLPVTADNAGKPLEKLVDIDPRLVIGANKLTLGFVAAPGAAPGDPTRPGLWAEVSGKSELEVHVQPLVTADDLAILPEPFFDKRDHRRLQVPFVFAAQPSHSTLRAGAVVASWLGQQARWRGARFPAHLDAMAPGHAVAFAANNERPAFLASIPPATGPQLRLMTNPADGRSKLLVVLGRDGEDLKAAATALVLGGAAMSGPSVQVKQVENKAPRLPYDAPGFVRLDRAIKLAELIDWPTQLQASGAPPDLDAVRVDLRVPPDLAAWRGPGVPLALKLVYTPPPCTADARIELTVNDELLQVLLLRTAAEPVTETRETFIPSHRLRSRNQLQFRFRFPLKDDPGCRAAAAGVMKAAVSPESTLDFSGFPHYTRMPNLTHFATVGFPFTRLADLSQTVVVMPDKPVAADIEVMLALMGRMGEAAGHPATQVRVVGAKDEAAMKDADLLVIGASPQQSLLDKWSDRLPAAISGNTRRVSASRGSLAAVSDWLGLGPPVDPTVATQLTFEGSGPIAAILGFESPLTSGRSVVAVTAVAPDQVLRVLDALENGDLRKAVRGSAAFVLPDKVESVLVGGTYTTGYMPPWTGAGHWAAERPVIAAIMALLVLCILAAAAYILRQRVRRWRMRGRA